jgi:hypothetical protein
MINHGFGMRRILRFLSSQVKMDIASTAGNNNKSFAELMRRYGRSFDTFPKDAVIDTQTFVQSDQVKNAPAAHP